MTLKDFINEAMEYARIALNRGDHEGFRHCMEIIADAIFEAYETAEEAHEVAEAHEEIIEA
jgi:hypothetical protein